MKRTMDVLPPRKGIIMAMHFSSVSMFEPEPESPESDLPDADLVELDADCAGERASAPGRAHGALRAAIRGGQLKPDDQLVEDTLVVELGVTRNALRHTLRILRREGLVDRRPRRGTVVTRALRSIAVDCSESGGSLLGETTERIDARRVPTPPAIVAHLAEPASTVAVVETLIVAGGEPRAICWRYLLTAPADLTEVQDAPTMNGETFRCLHGRALGSATTTIEAVLSDARTGRTLGIPACVPMLLQETIWRDDTGRVREVHSTLHRADRTVLTSEIDCAIGG